MSERTSGRRWWIALVGLYLAATGCRIGWVTVRYGDDTEASLAYPDEQAYWLAARSLAEGRGLIDEFGYRATYMPGYPAFLSVFAGASNAYDLARWMQALLGAWVAPATFLLAREWIQLRSDLTGAPGGRSFMVAVLAGAAAAFDPFLIFFAGLFLTETVFAALLVSTWAVVVRLCRPGGGWWMASLGGALLLAMVLLRPGAAAIVMAAPVVVLVVRWLGVRAAQRRSTTRLTEPWHTGSGDSPAQFTGSRHTSWSVRRAWGYAGMLIALVVVGLFPWAVRNRQVTGDWIWLTTRGGISLYDGLNPETRGESDLAQTKTDPAVRDLSEVQWDRHWRGQAWHFARSEPVRVLELAGLKFLRTWSLTPNIATHRRGATAWISLIWMVAVLGLAFIGWLRGLRPAGAWVALLTPVLVVTVQHMVFVGSVRYRVPVMPMMYVLSAYGLAGILARRSPAAADQEPALRS